MYDEYSENVAVEAPDKRIDLMSQFVDIDNEIGRLERELTERDKQLSAMRQEREGLRRKLDDVINGDQPVKAEGRFA